MKVGFSNLRGDYIITVNKNLHLPSHKTREDLAAPVAQEDTFAGSGGLEIQYLAKSHG